MVEVSDPKMRETFRDGLDFCGRHFSADEVKLIANVAHDFPVLSLTELSNTLCELLEWKRASARLKYKECRALLELLQGQGVIALPGLRKTAPYGKRLIIADAASDPQSPLTGSVGEYLPIHLHLVRRGPLSTLWRQFIDRYHYLGYRVPFGANLRYLIESERHPGQYLGCLLFSSPAWKMAARDAWIGWEVEQRKRNLQYVVSNSRFLILPWISVRGCASKVLSLAARQLPRDWERFYGYRPMLLETLVDGSRFQGTCYRAANWIYLGKTQGRGRMDRDHARAGWAVKDLYVFPLCRDVQRRLRESSSPEISTSDDGD